MILLRLKKSRVTNYIALEGVRSESKFCSEILLLRAFAVRQLNWTPVSWGPSLETFNWTNSLIVICPVGVIIGWVHDNRPTDSGFPTNKARLLLQHVKRLCWATLCTARSHVVNNRLNIKLRADYLMNLHRCWPGKRAVCVRSCLAPHLYYLYILLSRLGQEKSSNWS